MKTFTEQISVKATECDRFGHMRPDALFTAMQEGGERHARLLGIGHEDLQKKGYFFALARIHVSILRPVSFQETISHTTWPGQPNRFYCPRYHVFTTEDRTPVAAAGSLWVILDAHTRQLISPLKMDIALPDTSDLPAPTSLPIRIPSVTTDTYTRSLHTPRYTDYDVNGHVNNARYIAWLTDALGNSILEHAFIGDLIASYEKEIHDEIAYETHLARADSSFGYVILGPGGTRHFVASGTLTPFAG